MSTCRSCNAEILWARTERGKRMPLDVEPAWDGQGVCVNPSGLFILRERDHQEGPLALAAWGLDDEPHYVSHFATCPNADEHREAR